MAWENELGHMISYQRVEFQAPLNLSFLRTTTISQNTSLTVFYNEYLYYLVMFHVMDEYVANPLVSNTVFSSIGVSPLLLT